MPGRRGLRKRVAVVVVRVSPEQKARWIAYAGFEGVGVLIRNAVESFLEARPNRRVLSLDRRL
jgi:hypothetical protein